MQCEYVCNTRNSFSTTKWVCHYIAVHCKLCKLNYLPILLTNDSIVLTYDIIKLVCKIDIDPGYDLNHLS